uniref:Fgf8/17/18 fibroblast growth factor 8/17/18 n=1 Tax=Phallusia mammillata TaxID=59560 RepID=A0A6F9DC73_9ASCI|nr:Fgf8/17/18 fibroblast growth factor 8/17/18 [Phallusia mammillata]
MNSIKQNLFSIRSIIYILKTAFIIFLLFPPTLQKRRRKSIDDDVQRHINRQIERGFDGISSSITRHYEIYSRITGKRVQMKGRKVDANGKVGSKNAKFAFQSYMFGGQIMIQSVANGRYLCMKKSGRLTGRRSVKNRSGINKYCVFTEQMTEGYYDVFRNFQRPSWFLGFKANGRPKRGDRTAMGQQEVVLLKIAQDQSKTTETGGMWLDLEQRIREAFIKGTIARPAQVNALRSRQQTIEFTNDGGKTTQTLRNVMSDAPGKGDFETEIEKRRNITSFLTDGSDITLPPQESVSTATAWHSRATRKRDRARKNRKRNKKNRKNRTAKPTPGSSNIDSSVSVSDRAESNASHDAAQNFVADYRTHRPQVVVDPPTIPSVLKIRRTTVSKRTRRKRTKSPRNHKRARKNKKSRKNGKT